ncbi:TPA: hypothetical protein ACUT9N_002553 [Pseudomonas aeruginosa]
MVDVLYSPTIIFSVLFSLGVFAFAVLSMVFQSKLTRVTVIFYGLVLISAAGFIYYSFTKMALNGESLVNKGVLTKAIFDDFKLFKDLFAYLIPFVTAGIGTNMISDAVLKHQNYEDDFSVVRFFKDIIEFVRIVFTIPVLLVLGAGIALWSLGKLLLGIVKWAVAKIISLSRRAKKLYTAD